MSNGGDIVVQLRLEDGGYRVGVISAGTAMKQFKQSVDSTATSVKRLEEQQFSLGRKFRDLVLTLGNLRFVAMDVNDVFLRLPMAILKSAGELERMQVLMKGLSKELTEAGRAAEGMRDFKFVTGMAKNAPFEISALSDSFVKLKTAGIDPTNGSMQSLVDSVARFGGTGESLKRASVAIQQMAGKGVISMEELRQQLGEAVPTAMKDMADGMGVSMADLAKIVQTGTLAAGPAIAKMLVQMRINNEGAAADMMNTWVGMSARLKTEMQLAAQAITEAGFGKEAKAVLAEITEALQSPEFQRFGAEMGKDLGEMVRGIMQFSKVLVQYREEIGMVAKAWLAYKAATIVAGIGGASGIKWQQGAGVTWGAASKLRDEVKAIGENAAARKRMAADMTKAAMESAQADAQRLAKKLAADQAELASVRARNQAILAEDRRMHAAMAVNGGVQIPGQKGFQKRAAGVEYMADLSRQNSQLKAQERELAKQIDVTTTAMNASRAAALQKTRELTALMGATRMKEAATIAAGVAVKGFGMAMNLLGGPIGVAILAISGIVWWWNRAGAAAEESAARQKRAAAGMGQASDLAAVNSELIKAQADFEEAKAKATRGAEYRVRNGEKSTAQIATNRAAARNEINAVLEANRRVQDLLTQQAQIKTALIEDEGRQVAGAVSREADRTVRSLTEASQLKIKKLEEQHNIEAEAMKKAGVKDVAKFTELTLKFNKQKRDVMVASLNARAAALEAIVKDQEAKAEKAAEGSSARSGALEAARNARETAAQLRKEADEMAKTLATPDAFKPKKDDKKGAGDGESPFQKLIETLAAERARLDAELAAFDETENKGDKAAGIIAKLHQQWKDGKFTGKDGKTPSNIQMTSVIQSAVDIQNTKEDLKKRAELGKKAKEFADYMRGIEPEFLDAIEVLNDPLGKSKMGRAEKQATRKIGAMSLEELQTAAEKANTSVQKIKDELLGKAKVIDGTSFLQGVAEETRQINASLLGDTRAAATERLRAENEVHASKVQMAYDELVMSKTLTETQLAGLRQIVEASKAARASQLAKSLETPMDKLAAQWANTTENMQNATAEWANMTVDSIAEMTVKGKMDFRSLATSILSDLSKIILKSALSPIFKMAGNGVSSWISSILPFANGGIMTEFGSAPLKKYANGGIANSPQLALFGEGRMPEAYVPLPDGRTIPVTMKGGAGGGDNVQINITVHKSGGETSNETGNPDESYRRMGDRIKSVVREEMMNQARPGGMLYR